MAARRPAVSAFLYLACTEPYRALSLTTFEAANASCLFQKQIRRVFVQNRDSVAQMARSLRARRARACRPNARARHRGQNQQTKKGQE